MRPFTKKVVEIIADIPEGKVMTYGQIAAIAGSPRVRDKLLGFFIPYRKNINYHGNGYLIVKDALDYQVNMDNFKEGC